MNIVNFLFKHFDKTKTALISGDRSISYNSLCNNVIHFKNSINNANDVVVIYMANSIEFVIAYFAVLLAGKKVLLVNPMYPDTEVKKYLDQVHGDLLITNIDSALLKENYRILCPSIIDVHYEYPEIPDRTEEGAVIIPTSGTTGEAKLIMLTHQNICRNVLDIAETYSELRPDDVELIILPMTAIFCHTTQMLVPLCTGMTIDIWTGGFNIPAIIKEMKEQNVSYCQMVPAILRLFAVFYTKLGIELPYFKRTTVGGEPISVEELRKVSEVLAPIIILQGYGMTETSPVISSQLYGDDLVYGSAGKLMGSIELRIDPIEEGKPEGVIFVKGPSVCKQTYDGTALLDEAGWLNTGDIGYLDASGELFICGRQKNLIVVGGMNVYPEEVEGVIKGFPGVGDVLVYGEPNELKGEIVKAKITVREAVDVQKLQHFCADSLPVYKVPASITIVEELDKTYSSKIKRF